MPRTPGSSVPATSRSAARANDELMFRHLIDNGPSSRVTVARDTGMSRPTASGAAERLVSSGLVRVLDKVPTARGRTPEVYDVARSKGCAAALFLRTGRLALQLVDVRNQVVDSLETALPRDVGPDRLERLTREAVELVTERSAVACRAASVAVAAPVDPVTRRPLPLPRAPFPAADFDVADVFTGHCGSHVAVDNDVNLAALAEQTLGASRGADSVLYVYIGAGVGAALISGGALIRGAHGLAGEIGHMPLGDGTLSDRLVALGPSGTDGQSLDEQRLRALAQERPEDGVFEALAGTLSAAVAPLAVAFDPGVIVLGGPLSGCSPLIDPLIAALGRQVAMFGVTVVTGRLGQDGPLDGARLTARRLLEEALLEAHRDSFGS